MSGEGVDTLWPRWWPHDRPSTMEPRPPMKILHLYSDCRYTGPAQPVIEACRGLADRGHDVTLAYRDAPTPRRSVGGEAAAAGIKTDASFGLNRYIGLTDTASDLIRLPAFIRRERFDIVHTHLSHDAFLGALCVRLAGMGRRRPMIVRSLHRRNVLPDKLGNRLQVKAMPDGVVVFTPGFRRQYIERFGLDERTVGLVPPTIDTAKFDPARGSFKDVRGELGIDKDTVVIGIVGRFQAYRRMDLFMEAAKLVAEVDPGVRFMVVGQSSQFEQTVREPMRRLGLQKQIVLAGYRAADYIDALAAMDVFTLLMPGSDGTARAVREALAMGRPTVVSAYGMLPELAPDGKVGRVVQLEPRSLADGWLELVTDAARRQALGAAARRHAIEAFDIGRSVEQLEAFYEQLLALR